jgi:hypothetical protein
VGADVEMGGRIGIISISMAERDGPLPFIERIQEAQLVPN